VKYNHELQHDVKNVCKKDSDGNAKGNSIDANHALVQVMLAGDASARDKLITGNMPMVITIVDNFIKSNTYCEHLRDDLTSEGFLALTVAVDAIQRGKLREAVTATKYLSTSVKNAIRKLSVKAKKEHSREQTSDADLSMRTMAPSETVEEIDIKLSIEGLCDKQEQELVRLRKERYTFAEIEEMTGIYPKRARKILTRIEKACT
jgi:RNA polymerase sigma factor (sigma-70 family)